MTRFERFLAAHFEYAGTQALDDLRRSEFARLDVERQVYLDYTGGGLYAASQLREHAELLAGQVFGNPHSASPCSTATTALVEDTRRAILEYFNAPPDEYTAVFTRERDRRAEARRRSVPVRPRVTLSAHVRQSQLGERHPRVRAVERRECRIRADHGARPADRPPAAQPAARAGRPAAAPISLRFPRSRISPASNTRSISSTRRTTKAGMSCSTRRRSYP